MGLAQTPAVGAVAMVLMGASVGMHSTMSATLWAEFFGTRHLGAIRAMTGAVLVLGTAVGPAATGALIDQGISFPQQAFGIAVYFFVAGVLVGIGARRAAALMRAG
jgi:MFS family permease